MKKLLTTLLIASLFALTATAGGLQAFSVTTVAVAGSVATNVSATCGVANCAKSAEITVQVASTSASADTAVKTWVFNGSVDQVTWTSNVFTISYAGTGTTKASGITNLPPGQRFPFYQVSYVTNAAASVVMTNMSARVFTKD